MELDKNYKNNEKKVFVENHSRINLVKSCRNMVLLPQLARKPRECSLLIIIYYYECVFKIIKTELKISFFMSLKN